MLWHFFNPCLEKTSWFSKWCNPEPAPGSFCHYVAAISAYYSAAAPALWRLHVTVWKKIATRSHWNSKIQSSITPQGDLIFRVIANVESHEESQTCLLSGTIKTVFVSLCYFETWQGWPFKTCSFCYFKAKNTEINWSMAVWECQYFMILYEAGEKNIEQCLRILQAASSSRWLLWISVNIPCAHLTVLCTSTGQVQWNCGKMCQCLISYDVNWMQTVSFKRTNAVFYRAHSNYKKINKVFSFMFFSMIVYYEMQNNKTQFYTIYTSYTALK